MNDSIINTQDILDATNLCQDPETKGFDLQAGQTWIYPTNYPVRDYQYNIIQQALHKNTLVSLPTGLGKTFIAAVVMYNFYRWYPHGKIIFMAPTRPLVKQQVEACYDIMAIPQEATAELTGTKGQTVRSDIWKEKRVFFITPQVLQNDLNHIEELAVQIKCLVFDEAHKAKGNYAYCEVVRRLSAKSKLFRVLALSATPGNSTKDILEVGQNLLIAHLEFRTEDSADVKPYSFQRSLETVVVPLGDKLEQVRNDYVLDVLEKYTRALINYKVITGNCANLTKGKIFMILREYQGRNRNNTPHYAEITKNLNICVTLYHGFEVLVRHGLRGFLNFFDEHISKPLMRGNQNLINIMDDVREYLGPEPNVEPLTDGTYPELLPNTKFGHPKYYKLRDILLEHFQKNNDASTRVIVFFEYRKSVMEAFALLLQSRPLLKPRIFLGQGSGVTQKTQINVVKAFRQGDCNTLLSTSIAEEGLDVGEVDLIVCFDISNKSPIRMIQRMGRTGRKRDGRVVVMVTEGKEQQVLKDCLIYKSNLGNFTAHNKQLMNELYRDNPLMIPAYITPRCQKMHITVQRPVLKKTNNNLKAMFRSISSNVVTFDDDLDMEDVTERLGNGAQSFWNKRNPMEIEARVGFKGSLEKQRMLQAVGSVQHSKQSEMLVSLFHYADSKRYNIPGTQSAGLGQNLKQGDIRNLFSKATNSFPTSQDFRIPSSQNIPSHTNKPTNGGKFTPELILEITNFIVLQKALNETCKICNELFECPKISYKASNASTGNDFIVPDISILDSITSDELECIDGDDGESGEIEKSPQYETENMFSDTLDEVAFTAIENKQIDVSMGEKSFAYEPPKSFSSILKNYSVTRTQPDAEVLDSPTEVLRFFLLDRIEDVFGDEKVKLEEVHLFDKIEDVFGDEKVEPEEVQLFDKIEDVFGGVDEKVKPEEEVQLFDNIEDVFGLVEVEAPKPIVPTEVEDLDETVIVEDVEMNETKVEDFHVISCASPDIFDTSDIEESPVVVDAESPIISCSSRNISCAVKAKKTLFGDENVSKPDLKKLLDTPRSSFYKSKSNETFVEEAKKKQRSIQNSPKAKPIEIAGSSKVKPVEQSFRRELTIPDICDLTCFGLTNRDVEGYQNALDKKTEKAQVDLDISDVCDLSEFGITSSIANTVAANPKVPETLPAEALQNISDICDISCFFADDVKTKTSDKPASNSSQFDSPPITTRKRPSNSSEFDSPPIAARKRPAVICLSDSSDFETSPQKPTQMKTPNPTGKRIDNFDVSHCNVTQRKKTVSSLPKPKAVSSGPKDSTTKTQKSPIKRFLSLNANSDDDFEDTSPVFPKPKLVKPVSSSSTRNRSKKKTVTSAKPKSKKKLLFNEYIEAEAVLDHDENLHVSADETDTSKSDCLDSSFVEDEIDHIPNTQMQVEYLKSVRSPPVQRGKFKIPKMPQNGYADVFSQPVHNEADYELDSFCVNTEDVCFTQRVDELDELEAKLKKKKRKKKDLAQTAKRRRIILSDESD